MFDMGCDFEANRIYAPHSQKRTPERRRRTSCSPLCLVRYSRQSIAKTDPRKYYRPPSWMPRSSPAISDRARRFHDEGFFVLENVVPAERSRGFARRMWPLRRRARPGDGPARRRYARPRPPRQPLLRPRLGKERRGAAVPVLRPDGRDRAGGARRHRLPVQRAVRRQGRASAGCSSAGTRTPASSPTRTSRT